MGDEKLRKIAKAATPGPWGYINYDGPTVIGPKTESGWMLTLEREADARFIAKCDPPFVLSLLDELSLLRDVAEAAEAVRMLDWTTDEKAFQRLHTTLAAYRSSREGGEKKGEKA